MRIHTGAIKTTKKQAEAQFLELYPPHIFKGDKPAKRRAWNDYIDHLHKSGDITDRQVTTWGYPPFITR